MHSFFITGTDTGVGKTVLTAALLAEARRRGLDAVPMKPIQTGCVLQNDDLMAPDLEFYLAAAGLDPDPVEKELMCPCRLMPACSPHLAAAQTGASIDVKKIHHAFKTLHARHAAVLVEGAGGVLVPIDDRYLMVDLMRDLRLPVILAARAGLGTLNHILLSLRELSRANLDVFGVVLIVNRPDIPSDLIDDNVHTIEKLGGVPILSCMPFFQSLENIPSDFPIIGKFPTFFPIIGKFPTFFSNHWKIPDLFFHDRTSAAL